MGRVTFQDAEVATRVNRDFAATWKNCRPGYRVEHLEGERFEEIKRIPNGQASENVATLIATADGELLHVVAGHWKAKCFVAELDFAQSVAKAVAEAGDDAEARKKVAREMHRGRRPDGGIGELGRRVLAHAHRKLGEEALRPMSEVRGVTDYAFDTAPDAAHAGLERAMQRLHEAIVRKIEPLMREGKQAEAEGLLEELIKRIEK